MNQSLGIETLIEKREKLVSERDTMLTNFNNQIAEMDSCIELLSGKTYTEYMQDFKFDAEMVYPRFPIGSWISKRE